MSTVSGLANPVSCPDDPASRLLSRAVTKHGQQYHYAYAACDCPGTYVEVDVNQLDCRGQRALHVAIRKRNHRLVTWLLYAGADLNGYNKWGLAPLHVACEIGDIDTVLQLLHLGADPNVPEHQQLTMFSNQRRTPLSIASSHGHAQCLAAILEAGGDTEHTDYGGNSALHKAAVYGHVTCVKALLRHGAGPDIKNGIGATPLQLALLQRHSTIVQLLLDARCDVTLSSDELPSVLTLAATTGECEVLSRCLQSPADIDAVDRSQKTPMYYTFTGDVGSLRASYTAIPSQGVLFDLQYSQLKRRRETYALLVNRGGDVEQALVHAVHANTLTAKHFTLPQNVELFRLSIRACGFNRLMDRELEALFWQVAASDSGVLLRKLLEALPRLDRPIRAKLKDVRDWTGQHTEEAGLRYLEYSGLNLSTASWVQELTRQPRLLQDWCRHAIRRGISANVVVRVTHLPLPKSLKEYLTLPDPDSPDWVTLPISPLTTSPNYIRVFLLAH